MKQIHAETFEKWLRRVSQIFSAKRTSGCNHDLWSAVNVISGKAENLWIAACEPFFSGYAKLSRCWSNGSKLSLSPFQVKLFCQTSKKSKNAPKATAA